jgi:hypothetical protein
MWRNGKITMDQMISGGQLLSLSELKNKYIGVESKIMTLDEVYKRAEKYKPDFDYKIKQWANEFNATPILSNLKDKSRAKDKIDRLYEGNTDSIRDILRATLLVDYNNKVSVLLSEIKSKIGSDLIDVRNNYDKNHNSSDSYYDAKIDFVFNGIKTELQIHTISMYTAKEKAHILYEKRQAILKTGYKLTNDQRNEIKNINNAMREIFKGAK